MLTAFTASLLPVSPLTRTSTVSTLSPGAAGMITSCAVGGVLGSGLIALSPSVSRQAVASRAALHAAITRADDISRFI
jgi:hypothetical protein